MAGPAICYANWLQFAPNQEFAAARVESRMLLWCRRGSGELWVDGVARPLPPGGWLLLPWGHRIRYRADRRSPWLLGGAHLVPRCGRPFRTGISHFPTDALAGDRARADDPALRGSIASGMLGDRPSLTALLELLAERWARRVPGEAEARAQGVLALAEFKELFDRSAPTALPAELERAFTAARANPQAAWDVATLAAAGGCGTAWLTRLFRRYLRISPRRWIEAQRLELARRMLADPERTVADVSAAVGIADPLRFSRRFRALYGLPPRSWRSVNRGP